MTTKPEMTAADIAKAVAGGKLSALDATEAALARIKQHDTVLNSFTEVTADRASTASICDRSCRQFRRLIILLRLRFLLDAGGAPDDLYDERD